MNRGLFYLALWLERLLHACVFLSGGPHLPHYLARQWMPSSSTSRQVSRPTLRNSRLLLFDGGWQVHHVLPTAGSTMTTGDYAAPASRRGAAAAASVAIGCSPTTRTEV